MMSKTIVMLPSPNLTGLPVMPVQSFCNAESIISCASDSQPPEKSSMIGQMLQPTVDFRL